VNTRRGNTPLLAITWTLTQAPIMYIYIHIYVCGHPSCMRIYIYMYVYTYINSQRDSTQLLTRTLTWAPIMYICTHIYVCIYLCEYSKRKQTITGHHLDTYTGTHDVYIYTYLCMYIPTSILEEETNHCGLSPGHLHGHP